MMRLANWSVVILLAACRGAAGERSVGPPEHDGTTTSRPAGLGVRSEAPAAEIEPGMLATVRAVPVVGWTGPGNRPFEVALRSRDIEFGHSRSFGRITLRTTLRGTSPNLVQYPCSSCHFGRTVAMQPTRIGDAHQNIQPQHPELLESVCSTCHSADAVDMLALRTGERVGLDHSYRLCAQCHFAETHAWAGGGHGKRLDGWQGRRVVMGCTDCHDPHRPATAARIPFRGPVLERRSNR